MAIIKKNKMKKKTEYITFSYNPSLDGWKLVAIAKINKIENENLNKKSK